MRTALEGRRPLDPELFLRVVDCVYAAACAEISWDRALEELCGAGGFGGCVLSSIDPAKSWPIQRAAYPLSDLAGAGVAPGRIHRNPLLTDEVLRSMPGTIWHDREVMSPVPLAATPFWTDWMQPYGFVSWTGIVVGRDGAQVICLEIYNRRDRVSPWVRREDLLARLATHLSRAWRLAKTARATLEQCAALTPPSGPHQAMSPAPAVNRLRAEFGLTRAEARLALYLADGASLPSMAQAFDVKLTTIRSQLQQVFAKTGTSRQAELVAMLLSHGYAGSGARRVEPVQENSRARSGYDVPALQNGA